MALPDIPRGGIKIGRQEILGVTLAAVLIAGGIRLGFALRDHEEATARLQSEVTELLQMICQVPDVRSRNQTRCQQADRGMAAEQILRPGTLDPSFGPLAPDPVDAETVPKEARR